MIKARKLFLLITGLILLGVPSLTAGPRSEAGSTAPWLLEWPATPASDLGSVILETGSEVSLTEEDAGKQVEIRAGDVLVVRLEASPSTGYLWEIETLDENALMQVGSEFVQQSNLLGAPGERIMRFYPLKAGDSTLSLVYRRPWRELDPFRFFSVEVQVTGTFQDPQDSAAANPTPTPAPQTEPVASPIRQPNLGYPPSFNWCEQSGCTPVKDQGSCGSCWAFVTAGVFESAIRIQDGLTRDLAEQYLVSCNTDGWGCDGGWWAFDYYQYKVPPGEPHAGAVYEADFPYQAADVSCNPPHPHYEKITSWGATSAIKQAIQYNGPVAVAICVGPAFVQYNGGVFETDESYECPEGLNHGVVLVGWDDHQGSRGIWHLKNSWGTDWGENGYMRIGYGISDVGADTAYVDYAGGTNAGPLMYQDHSIDDDASGQSDGNGDGHVDCGETVELYVDLHNQGGDAASAVAATISTSDPYVTWLDNTYSTYPDTPGGGTSTNRDDFEFAVDPGTPDGHTIQFDLDITSSNGGPWFDTFQVPATCQPPGPSINVAVDPSRRRVHAGTVFTMAVAIEDADDLGGFEFHLGYSPDVVQVDDVVLGPFPGGSGRTWSALGPSIDNSAGLAYFGGFSFGDQSGASGSGDIAKVRFLPQIDCQTDPADDSSALDLQNVQVIDVNGSARQVTVQDGQVTITCCPWPPDFDGDGDVDVPDIMYCASLWGCQAGDACYDPCCDVDGDGDIDIADIMQVAAQWGWSDS
jgi:predicted secreted protein